MDSRIYLETGFRYGKTQVTDVFFNAPYKIASPFYEKDYSEIMLMSASAGLMGGDRLQAKYYFRQGSSVRLTSQSYEKILDTQEDKAVKTVRIHADEDTIVRYIPFPVIPFAGSSYENDTEVRLAPSASLYYADIFTCGRSGMGELFQMKSFRSRLNVYKEDRLIFADHTWIVPEHFHCNSLGLWHEYTHNGMLYICLQDKQKEKFLVSEALDAGAKRGLYVGASQALEGSIIRVLGNSGDEIYRLFAGLI